MKADDMRRRDRVKRAIAFYFCVALFCILLPVLLSYSLGYQIDFQRLRIYKTGILYVESRPAGAAITLSGRMLNDVTPAQIEELKPGIYKVEVRRDGFYPWEKEIVVRPNMVTRADRIVLFPITQEMRVISERSISDFAISGSGYIYYMKKSGLFRTNMDGTNMKRFSAHAVWPSGLVGKKFSPDGDKFLYFSRSAVGVVYLNPDKSFDQSAMAAKVEDVFTSADPIIDVFWYPGSGYIIVVTDKDIKVVELGVGTAPNTVPLYKFNAKPESVFYDEGNNSLYFVDTRIGADSRESNYLYRLDMKKKFFDAMIKMLSRQEPNAGYEKR